MNYLSVCSGIEAASVAWHPLGWTPVAFSEVDAFPSAVLRHHYPHVENLGDMTRFKEWPDAALDLLVGGTPCQSFSVAGLRAGLDDPRGQLMLVYLAIARRYRPRWVVWENVPGVLSADEGRAFGSLLGGLAELGYGFAYRVLDAQYIRVESHPRAVPQRRRRVFVVGHLGDWRRAAAVLFERASLSGHPPPSRQAREVAAASVIKGAAIGRKPSAGPQFGDAISDGSCYTLTTNEVHAVAPTIPSRRTAGGGLGTDFDCDGGLVPYTLAIRGRGESHDLEYRRDGTANAILTPNGGRGGIGVGAIALRADGFDASEDGTGRGTPLVPCAFDARQSDVVTYGAIAGPLDTDGTSQAIAFSVKDHGADASVNVSPTLRAGGHTRSHANGGVKRGELTVNHTAGALTVGGGKHGQGYPAVAMANLSVRRLTPLECERLQGFPDGYTDVPYKGKPAKDGPRYKALGNSMAVNVMRWISDRINLVERL